MFTHDTVLCLTATVALVNTAPEASNTGTDEMLDLSDLSSFAANHSFSGRIDGDDDELQQVRTVRDRLSTLWDLGPDDLVDAVNALLDEHRAMPQLVRHDGHDWHIHAINANRPLADRIAVEAAMGIVDLIRTGEHGRLRSCDSVDCDAVLIDLSRNRSRRFCDVGNCANRSHVAAYRARKAAHAG